MSHWRLLLTRPQDECAALAASLAEHGVASASLPLLAIEPLEETPEQRSLLLDLDRYCAVVVVSKPAARLGLERIDRYWPQPPARQDWFAVGAATAAILDDYGLRVHHPENGDDSEALLALPALARALQVPGPRALILRGEGGREFLAERLRGQGVAVDYLELYRRVLPGYPAGELARRVRDEALNGLVVSSGQGLEHLLRVAGEDWPRLAGLPLFVPSPRVAELAREAGARHVIDCRGANAAALLEALRGADEE
ncbi:MULTISPECIES: uroporphyrinogen-III synthase [Pseudomonas]|uniref:Uroporphyrinogen-III synthase n=1 Tax=Pseudomonas citronellolis TaxID=53408 RepID=A0A1A9K584_9PSED|nr:MULTISPECIES: uroporphyrinogen-III synthase [Pseudomonas]NTX90854.1 uroporphyrinogen-III synthase [Pseudomonas sp. UMA643]NTY20225.1 uroporphyrinogen-III synthase [Pseudomonas sp. UMC3103]NTY26740.1 uroporphyrinogen-III synthase [Pseudomonas sp. UMA603]NTY31918.1 uroporphyrinogen-III synthase [Pseudomonas sp. UMC3129]NTY55489.1 uroporphyrinogen-III synthase [Pseudomonas sp. UMC631]NTY67662.1 uroporphyrinogen-III synthase [Pseudomonas sp. UMC3106]NUA37815.1 uroporphyrinogen-III synthase [P